MTTLLPRPRRTFPSAKRGTSPLLLLLLLTLSLSSAWVLPSTSTRTTTTSLRVSLSSPDLLMFRDRFDPQPARAVFTPNAATVSEDTEQQEQQTLPPLPERGSDNIYHLESQEQHQALLEQHPESIVVLKFYAPWCRACKALAPKFAAVATDPKYDNLPLIFADLSVQHNKDFVKSLGVLALPTCHFYVARQLQDSFPCGPSKVKILRKKLAATINTLVDPDTRCLKDQYMQPAAAAEEDLQGSVVTERKMTAEEKERFSQTVPYMNDLGLAELDAVLDKAVLRTFPPQTILMRQGEPGRTFYLLQQGSVEICQSIQRNDPLISKRPDYLGTVLNVLGAGDYFGERALITGEPRAASIRSDTEIQVWTLDSTDFPASSVLSGRTRSQKTSDALNDKYGVELADLVSDVVPAEQQQESSRASQSRGSANSPRKIKGVDYDVGVEDDWLQRDLETAVPFVMDNEAIFSTLSRFHMIRRVRSCLEYVKLSRAVWGDVGNRQRRSMLVSRLPTSRRDEIQETFELLDANKDGSIELLELQRVLERVKGATDMEDSELLKDLHSVGGRINLADFMGLMAEAEFFYLFRDVFSSLDKNGSGFVRAKDLDLVLSGVRDLISDDRKSIIDVEDTDMHIDYEQFSRMLLGTDLA